MAADYSLLGGGFSVANALAALGAGQQQQAQQQQFAMQRQRFEREERELRRQDQLRSGLQGAYDANSGNLDPMKARAAYAAAGDVPGALSVDRQATAARTAQFKEQAEKAGLVAQLLGGVRDEQSYQRARQVAAQNGLDVSSIPPQYDVNWVQTTRTQAMTLMQQLEAEAPKYQVIPEGGTLVNTRDPRALNAVASPSRVVQPPSGQQDYASMAKDAIARGADPASVQAVLRQLQGQGGAPSQGGATFP